MPRPNKIWYWKARGEWCVKVDGKRHRLGPDKDKAEIRFHELMANRHNPQPLPSDSLAVALDEFLDWTQKNRAQRTHERYSELLQSFLDFVGNIAIQSIKPFIVQQWYESHDWNQTTQNTAIRAVKRALNWAEDMGYCDRNPIARMPVPRALARDSVVTDEEFTELIGAVKDHNFADLLTVSYDCGIRPQEVKKLEARHVQLQKKRAISPTSEGKKETARAFYIPTERSLAIIRRLMEDHPEGPIFLNCKGNPWTRSAVKCRFARLEEKLGRRFRQYDFRRTWITKKIIAGVDSHVVAKLAGHKSTAMLDRHYSVIAEDHEFMLNAARQGEESPAEE